MNLPCSQFANRSALTPIHFAKARSHLITQPLRFSKAWIFNVSCAFTDTRILLHTAALTWLSVSQITRWHLIWNRIDIQSARCTGLTLSHTFRRLNKAEPLFSTPRSVRFFLSVSTSLNYPCLANRRGSRVCSKPMGCEVTECSSCTEALHQRRWHAEHPHPITAAPAVCVFATNHKAFLLCFSQPITLRPCWAFRVKPNWMGGCLDLY